MGDALRITVITAHFPPMAGGVADYSMTWAQKMADRGHEVTVVTSAVDPDGCPEIGIVAYRGPWTPFGISDLTHVVARTRPEVLVLQWVPHAFSGRGGGLGAAVLIRAVQQRLKVPLVVHAHEMFGAWSESLRRLPWHAAQRAAMVILARVSVATVVTVERRRAELARLLPERWRRRIVVIPVGATVAAHEPDPHWRSKRGISEDAFLIASFGLAHPTQDASFLVTALEALRRSEIDAVLVLAGRLAVGNVDAVHVGYLSEGELSSMAAASDLLLLPFTDGVSARRSSVISALSMGVAILTTRGEDTETRLFPPDAIIATKAGDPCEYGEAAVRLAKDDDLRKGLETGARLLFAREFSWTVLAPHWEKLLRDGPAPTTRLDDR